MKLQVPFIQLPVMFDAAALLREATAFDESAWRPRSAHEAGNSALTLITTDGDPDSDALTGDMRPTPWLEQSPYMMQVLSELGATWGRARLMRLDGSAEVKAHVDVNYYWRERMRVHIPIVTTPDVRFQCGDAEVNMKEGECWIFDTWRQHRVLNSGHVQRIHLVADTVGGERFWDLLSEGRAPGKAYRGEWRPRMHPPAQGGTAYPDFERVNAPAVMSPWELREHMVFLLGECVPGPRLGPIQSALLRFSRCWQALWARYGEDKAGRSRYQTLLDATRKQLLGLGVEQIALRNEVGFWHALSWHVLDMALPGVDITAQRDVHGEPVIHAESSLEPAEAASRKVLSAAKLECPVFVVSPPRSGSTLLFETLAGAPDVYTIGDESHQVIEGIDGLSPMQRNFDSNRLDSADATPVVVEMLQNRFLAALRNRSGSAPDLLTSIRMLEKTPKNALRIPFIKAVFPDAKFIFLHRDPRQVCGSMIDGWKSGRFQMYSLPDWKGPAWSFLLTPGWRELSGQPLAEIVVRQWETAMRLMLDDLESLPPADWTAVDYERFLANPQQEAMRLSRWADWSWDCELDDQLPLSRYTLTQPDPDKWRRHAAEIEPRLSQWRITMERAASAAGL
ncbi:sulfotransferase [Pseudoxanthomonas kalamensis]|uniref:sulfotransferase n=1 Tax=Pseudoxanthomonas kalamensis TaxID=289483 RepID=UPI0013913828|nr:sulfotransferase [Pseudoxanthomonas kalamensis]